MQPLKKILIIAPSWVGDLIMAQALFKLIKQQNANCCIHLFANRHLHSLIEHMPEVDFCIESSFQHGELRLTDRWQLGKMLRSENYTQAIILPNSFKSALIPFFAKIPLRTGWRGEARYLLLNDLRTLDQDKLPLMVDRYLKLGLEPNAELPKKRALPELQINRRQIKTVLSRLQIKQARKPILAICPGAEYGPAKRWPTNYFAEIAHKKFAEKWQIWIFGSTNDQEIATEIQNKSGNICIDLTGKTTLGEAVDLMSLAKVVVTNDSGLMHIAAALNLPSVAIYGSSSPQFTPPLCEKAKILSLHLSCSPCFKRECPLKHYNCLRELRPELVLATIKELS